VAGNAMAQSIRERTSELAVLKTVGFSDGRILTLVLVESCVVALLGGGLGLLVAWAIISQGDPTNGLLPAFYFPIANLLLGIVLVLVLGIGTGLLPAVQAQRLKIVNALRRA
jgi:putative ABC transport system permease protein